MKLKEVKDVIRESLGIEDQGGKPVNESFVAIPKAYVQNSDSISKQTREDHSQLYMEYISSFNKISANLDVRTELSILDPNNSQFRALKQFETHNRNAIHLHELYFANCGDVNSEILMESLAYMRLQRDFGSFESWQHDFIACGLVAGNGWAVCAYDTFLKRFHNFFIDEHAINVPIGTYPVIVIDLWEHARKDYRNDVKAYIVSQMIELNWSVIEERVRRAEIIAEAIR